MVAPKFTFFRSLLLLMVVSWPYLTNAAHIRKSEAEVATNDNDDISVMRFMWNWFMDNMRSVVNAADETDVTPIENPNNRESENLLTNNGTTVERSAGIEGRTFGKIRRLQMAMIPIVFKFGVISAMITFLVMLGLKSLFLLKLLVLINTAAIIGKFLTLKTDFLPHVHQPMPSWNPYMHQGWTPTAPAGPPSKEIHLHLHGLQAQSPHGETTYSYGPPSSSQIWNRRSNEPYSSQLYNNFNAQAALDERTAVVNEVGLNGADGANQEFLPTNHRNF